jgi:Ca2+-binding EF-hand superfamily protein
VAEYIQPAAVKVSAMPLEQSFASQSLTIHDASRSKAAFVSFIMKATSDHKSVEFRELYEHLLKCFTDADTNYDGLIDAADFDDMVDFAAALPRQFGFAPSTIELYKTTEGKTKAREAFFKKINVNGSGFITFNQWLSYMVKHITEKAKQLHPARDTIDKMTAGRQEFAEWVVAACRSRSSPEYKELYKFLLDCFTQANHALNGRVGPQEFDQMIDIAAEAPRVFGFAPSAADTYATAEEKFLRRKQMFDAMDEDRSGDISFEEWLRFCYTHICAKAQLLDNTLTGVPPSVETMAS